jgi:hypothetical protein
MRNRITARKAIDQWSARFSAFQRAGPALEAQDGALADLHISDNAPSSFGFGGVSIATDWMVRRLRELGYWFVHLGQVAGILESSRVSFKDSDLALLPEPPEHTWKIGRRNPAFGRPELDRHVFRAGFKAVEQMLNLWKQEDEGVVDAYALKELKLSRQRLAALTNTLNTLQRTQEVIEISVMKYWYDPSWPGKPFPCDLVIAEFSLNLPLQFRWAASDGLLYVEVMHLSFC